MLHNPILNFGPFDKSCAASTLDLITNRESDSAENALFQLFHQGHCLKVWIHGTSLPGIFVTIHNQFHLATPTLVFLGLEFASEFSPTVNTYNILAVFVWVV